MPIPTGVPTFHKLNVSPYEINGIQFSVDLRIGSWHWVSYRTNGSRSAMPEIAKFESMTRPELEREFIAMLRREDCETQQLLAQTQTKTENQRVISGHKADDDT
jgi:hypothetical protein